MCLIAKDTCDHCYRQGQGDYAGFSRPSALMKTHANNQINRAIQMLVVTHGVSMATASSDQASILGWVGP